MGRPSHEVETSPRCVTCSALARPGHALCDAHWSEQAIAAARRRLVENAGRAVDVLVELQESPSADIAWKAATAILDRAGLRPGVEVAVGIPARAESPAEVLKERLELLRRRTSINPPAEQPGGEGDPAP